MNLPIADHLQQAVNDALTRRQAVVAHRVVTHG